METNQYARIIMCLLFFGAILVPGCPGGSPEGGEGGVSPVVPQASLENESGGISPAASNATPGTESPQSDGETLQIAGNESGSPDADSLLQDACAGAMNDYPLWALIDTELIIWENADKTLDFRNSPEEMGIRVTSPVLESEMLADMDILGENEVSYAVLTSSGWELGLFKLNGMDVPANSRIYSSDGEFSGVDVSPINREEFIVLYYGGGENASLEYLDSSSSISERILGISVIGGEHKLAVSPSGTYVYVLHDGILELFNISAREKTGEIGSVEAAVWVGDSHILYSTIEGTFIYDVESGGAGKISGVGSASSLHFIPKGGGEIAYTESGNSKVIGCVGWKQIAFKEEAEVLAFAGDKTLIIKKDGNCFWRFFNSDWTLRVSDEVPLFATVWERY